jgi:Ribbon-helix-helix protein, copG family.
MGMRTVRLDDETEKLLQRIMRETGLSVSSALKKGLLALRDEISEQSEPQFRFSPTLFI